MSTISHVCPSPEQLHAFARGQLTEADLDLIGLHLEDCPSCQASAEAAPPDAFMAKLPGSARPPLETIDDVASGPDVGPQRQSEAADRAGLGSSCPRVAGYTLGGQLGRGGMGVVYAARHQALKRPVALKMIRSGAIAGPEELARFRAEAEAVAQLQHPNIVQVFEVGDWAGTPFMALEFCGGGTLAAHLAGTPLPARPAAALAETLARAVHAAHLRGVVHRDLKPSNILLTETGVPKISDYGLAKRLDADSGQTATGAVLGTPSYMAPEQAEGAKDVGPAADVWALGAILYELLTARPPFRGPSVPETLEQVRKQEPVPVRRLQPKAPRDLETICLKCLEKEPRKRYASAAELADDLRRFLDARPIHARPVRWPGRALRWARRNPGWAAVVILVLLAVTGGAAGVLVYDHDLGAALDRARAERDQAEGRYRQTRKVVDFMAAIGGRDLAGKPGAHAVQRRLLEEVLQYYEGFLAEHSGDPALEADLAATYAQVGQITSELGKRELALKAYTRAVALYEGLLAAAPGEWSHRRGLAVALNDLGILRHRAGANGGAETTLRRALVIRQELAAADPAARAAVAATWHNLAICYSDRAQYAEALRATRQALAIRQELAAANRGAPIAQRDLAASLNTLARLQKSMGQPDRAAQALESTATALDAALQRWPQSGALQYQLAQVCNNLGVNRADGGRFKEAEARYRQAVELHRKIVAANPGVIAYQHDLVKSQLNLGGLLSELGRVKEGLPLLRQATARQKLLTEASPDDVGLKQALAHCLHNLATGAVRLPGKAAREDGVRFFREALALQEELTRGSKANLDFQHDLALTRYNLACSLRDAPAAKPEALALLNQARAAWEGLTARQPADARFAYNLVHCYGTLGSIHRKDGNAVLAQGLYEKALKLSKDLVLRRPAAPHYQKTLSNCYDSLGLVQRQLGRAEEAVACHLEAARRWPAKGKGLARAARRLVDCLPLIGDPAKRERCATQAVGLLRSAVEMGAIDIPQLRTDAALSPLCTREDFRQLLKAREGP